MNLKPVMFSWTEIETETSGDGKGSEWTYGPWYCHQNITKNLPWVKFYGFKYNL